MADHSTTSDHHLDSLDPNRAQHGFCTLVGADPTPKLDSGVEAGRKNGSTRDDFGGDAGPGGSDGGDADSPPCAEEPLAVTELDPMIQDLENALSMEETITVAHCDLLTHCLEEALFVDTVPLQVEEACRHKNHELWHKFARKEVKGFNAARLNAG